MTNYVVLKQMKSNASIMNFFSRIKQVLVVLVILILAACQQEREQFQPPPPEVTVAPPLVKEIVEWDEYTGRLQAVEEVEIRARVSGYLESVHFKDGAIVEKDDLLFIIDPRPYQAVLDQSTAEVTRTRIRLQLAKNDLERAKRLFKSRAISEEELDSRTQEERQAVASLEAANAAVNAAELNVEFSEIRAPVSGRIGRNLVDVGNLISGGSADSTLLTTIVSLDPIHVYVTVDERAFLKYVRLDREGSRPSSRTNATPVQMQLADEKGFPHHGYVDFVDNRIDIETGTMQGRAIFDNPDLVLTPGLFAKIRVPGKGPYEAIFVPDEAILSDQSKKFVFVIDANNSAVRKEITLGRVIDGLRIITSGLNENDSIVINGVQRVRAGTPVNPIPTEIKDPAVVLNDADSK